MGRETQRRTQRGIIKISENGIVSLAVDVRIITYEIECNYNYGYLSLIFSV